MTIATGPTPSRDFTIAYFATVLGEIQSWSVNDVIFGGTGTLGHGAKIDSLGSVEIYDDVPTDKYYQLVGYCVMNKISYKTEDMLLKEAQ